MTHRPAPPVPPVPPTLHLALELDGPGAHLAASSAQDAASPQRVRDLVAAAENAGITFVTFEDSLLPGPHGAARIDAVTRAAFVAPLTSRIGLVPLVHPALVEPFHAASQLSALDHASAGRAGWLVGAGPVPGARAALDRPVPEGAALAGEIADVVQVVRALWDSWEDDAVIRDTATGRYIDRERLHYVDFTSAGTGEPASPASRALPDGARAPFTVKGPLIVPRSPQGQGVVVARVGTVPADLTDVALVDGEDVASVAVAAEAARAAGTPLVFANVTVTLSTSAATGAQRAAALDAVVFDAVAFDAAAFNAAAEARPGLRWVGDAAGLVALLTELAAVVDGVRLLTSELDEDLPVLVREVLPALRVARLTPTPQPGATLRQTLGLAHPANRFATDPATTFATAPVPANA
ncbi:Flavin-dependent oxidoreductase, luciferase family (includes alkanesulfonate monooxygenase SsuD and methylene tetrahydromethanopterin reductase) [Sanguibacter gelidistatuariae]|uniref:Flavin-dependent oxidoreductase, luciferase family (Includes alkanesulfonate monooxygenase SsuD and methylene tetrahydromethanopterin reductase) n=1 Tax=Sanguibacter gelidistatuariae TaxID=1814289 RepID=A0A1G6HIX8_9MICO|nr:LLM class flavin-dependent oxidoreductase [Sanguibacter gelidistatuariae]SDB93396.1 Flavin-dependent oxidoreductase, luciferase family (includes alkanesulfonate monooxygenase SsuD and methylene tetrahydromethanopterin reductase) [Sanguibacter gelidistatuariae]